MSNETVTGSELRTTFRGARELKLRVVYRSADGRGATAWTPLWLDDPTKVRLVVDRDPQLPQDATGTVYELDSNACERFRRQGSQAQLELEQARLARKFLYGCIVADPFA